MKKKETIHERISQLVDYFGDRKNTVFAKLIGESEANVRGYKENVVPKHPFLEKIVRNLDVSPLWLLTGDGQMLRSGEPINRQESPGVEERLFAIIKEKDERIEVQARKIGQLEGQLDARYEQSEFLAGRNVKSAIPNVPVGSASRLSGKPTIPASERVKSTQQPNK